MRDIDARRLSPSKKREILERDQDTCMYCLDTAEEVDHIVPWSFRHDDSDENLVAACWLCNHIASNKVFDSFKEKRSYLLERKNKILRNTVIPIWTEVELAEMGRVMKLDILSNCIVASDRSDAVRIAARIKAVGLEVRLGR